MIFNIKEISDPKEIKKFIKFPHKLYKQSGEYVPPLDSAEYKILTKSASLEHSQLRMWLAYSQNGQIVGRVAGIINSLSNSYHNEKRIRFGWFDFIDQKEVAEALLHKVIEWGREQGMDEIHGPLGFNTWNRQGMMVDGFENMPPVNCIYNFSYYPNFMEALQFEKQFDWVQLKIKANAGVPEKLFRINKLLMEKHNLRTLSLKELKSSTKYVDSFFDSYNDSFSKIENFVPLTAKEIEEIRLEYIPKLKERLTSIIVDTDDDIAAFGITFPSLSKAFRRAGGKLFPFGLLHILRGMKKYNTVDLMLLGSSPKWRNSGISSIYHTTLATYFKKDGVEWAITNPQEENNSATKVWERYGGVEHYMRRRCYIKKI